MRNVAAIALMVAAFLATLALLVARLLGEPLNLALFVVGVAAWILGGTLWRMEE